MIRRKLFFWLDRMKITPAERRAVAASMLLLLLLLLVNASVKPPAPYDAEYYRALEEAFVRRAARIARREAEQRERYFPPPAGEEPVAVQPVPIHPARADTLSADSLSGDSVSGIGLQSDFRRININTAGAGLLQELPGIGPVYAERIIRRRAESGPFESVEELLEIRGIGVKRLEKIKPFVKI